MIWRLAVTVALLAGFVVEADGQVRLRALHDYGPAPVTITLTDMPDTVEDEAYPQQVVTVTGGTGPYYTCAVTSGSLPAGMSEIAECTYDDGGVGLTTPGMYTFTITATDSLSAVDTQDYSIEVTAAGGLPAGWSSTNIGSPGCAGSASESGGTWTIVGCGTTYGTSDSFRFVYRTENDGREVVANWSNCTTTAAFGEECAAMVRVSTDADSAYLACVISDSGSYVEWRLSAGGSTGSDTGPSITSGYTRVQTAGGVAHCDVSSTGAEGTWAQVGSAQTLPYGSTILIGGRVDANEASVGSATATGTAGSLTVNSWTPPSSTDFGSYRGHWQGHGAQTVGGRTGGSRVCVVNTLTISGTPTWGATGDLLDCLAGPAGCDAQTGTQSACARFVLFSVSGTIGDTSTYRQVSIDHPYLTIAGQTAPSCNEGSAVGGQGCGTGPGGIQIVNIGIVINAQQVVVQHLRLRYSSSPGNDPILAIGIGGGDHSWIHDVAIDHVSIAWAIVGYPSLFVSYGNGGNLGIFDTIIAEAIYPSGGGSLALGIDIGLSNTTTVARSLFVSNLWRQPSFGVPGRGLFYNNVIYNFADPLDCTDSSAQSAAIISDRADSPGETGGGQGVWLNNAYITGPSSGSPSIWICGVADQANLDSGIALHLSGNSGPGVTACSAAGNFNGMGSGSAYLSSFGQVNVITSGPSSNIRMDSLTSGTLSWVGALNLALIGTTGSCSLNTAVRDAVLANAGARPLDGTVGRDAADARFVGDVTDGGGDNTISWSQVVSTHGGIPAIATRSRTCSPPSNPNDEGSRTLTGGGVNTRIEDWLEGLADYDGTANCGARRLEVSQGVP